VVIDTSALIAILLDEPEAPDLAARIAGASHRRCSAVTMYEASVVIETRRGTNGLARLDLLVSEAGIATKAQLAAVLDDPAVFFDTRFVREDLIRLRRAYAADDAAYADAISRTAREIQRARKNAHLHGDPLEHGLVGWRRSNTL
jgi:uncharacterized protein with PIN domain